MKKLFLLLLLLMPLTILANVPFFSYPVSYPEYIKAQDSSQSYVWDDTAAIQAFINGGGGSYPFGHYVVTSLTINHSFSCSNCDITTTISSGTMLTFNTSGVSLTNTIINGAGSGGGNTSNAVNINSGVNNVNISFCAISHFGQYGMILNNSSGTVINNNTITDIGYLGISLVVNSGAQSNIQITNNTIDRTAQGISVPQPALIVRCTGGSLNHVTVTGNDITMPSNPTSAAGEIMEIRGVTLSTISNNTFNGGSIGISAVGGANNLTIDNNTINGTNNEAVEIGASTGINVTRLKVPSGKIGVLFDGSTATGQDTIANSNFSGLTSFTFQIATASVNGIVLNSDTAATTNTRVVYVQLGQGVTINNMVATGNSTNYPIYLDGSIGSVFVNNSSFTGFTPKIFFFNKSAAPTITVNNVVATNVTISPGTVCYNTSANITVGPNVSCTTITPPNISYSPNSYVFTKNAPISTITPTNSGGSSTTWSIDTPQPSGILFNTATGVFTGTPTVLSPMHTYHITASNGGGTSTTPITFTVVDVAPNIHYTPNSQTIVINTAMTNMNPVSTGGTVVSYSISPSLPTGLNFNTSTGVISGTPTVLSGTTNYTVTAFNSGGSFPTTVTLTVNPPAPVISYSPSSNAYPINVAISPWTPTNTGGAATSWGISPTLPTGLSFNTSTGVITGTPTVLSSPTNYTVSATNVTGTGNTTITISVINVLPPPPVPLYSPNIYTFFINTPISTITPSNSGGTAVSWAINVPLPTGLSFDTSTGIISGTPTVLSGTTTYSVTATNSGGSNSTPITITVIAHVPVPAYSPSTEVFPINVAITVWTPTNSGGLATSWGISPGLPTGLNFDTSSGIISGTPTVASPATVYTVSANNGTGTGNTNITISVVLPNAPVISYHPNVVTLTLNRTAPNLIPTNTGGTATSWGISPSLPTGLNFDTSTGIISGTPTVISPQILYTITATNLGGSGTAPLTISVIKKTIRVISFPGKIAKYGRIP